MARPKAFDPQAALDRAMTLMWERGYEATSIADLTSAMGIGRRSLYDTYGDKRSLLLKCLDHYVETVESPLRDHASQAGSPAAGLRELLQSTVDTSDGKPAGCLIANCATEVAWHDPDVRDKVCRSADASRDVIKTLVTRRFSNIETGEREALTENLLNGWMGLRMRARASTDPATELASSIDHLVELLA
jgi:TetR/AcrR family transcriptional repressor of nem operon